MADVKVSNALISVSNKTKLVPFVEGLKAIGIALMSTGGTHRLLTENDLSVQEVADYTGFPEMMDGRVKTLHPRVHGGLLGRRDQDQGVMRNHNITPIDLLVVNLYPFKETVAAPDCTFADAIENIDIGGPAMLRSAAKNMKSVAVVVDVSDYEVVLEELAGNHRQLSDRTRFRLAVKAFQHVAHYDAAIADYLTDATSENL